MFCTFGSLTDSPRRSGERFIAVLGVTGSGKSSFIELCTGRDENSVGHSLYSAKSVCARSVDLQIYTETTEVKVFPFEHKGTTINLIDTPGFDDTNRTDTEVLRDVASWLGDHYKDGQKLNGIIYLHRITDPRMGGAAKKNLWMFKRLCGEGFYPSVVLATTMWETVAAETGKRRENELTTTEEFWGHMHDNGSVVKRHYNNRKSALEIVDILMNKEGKALDIQVELAEGKELGDTGAGRAIDEGLGERKRKLLKEIQELERDKKDVLRTKDREAAQQIAEMQDDLRQKIEKGDKERAKLKASLDKILAEKEADHMARLMNRGGVHG
ncbi:P-loop containing nucleoside triphosphate hydrolase protein [Morchella snyderi]|nr:P-loop containing nucleoside triphosphate hydrolase protein [Morchella snyderi]